MENEKNGFSTLEEVKEDELKKIAGGWELGSDKYTISEYSQAGVTWEHNIWSKDRYFVRGIKISQSLAEKITEFYFQRGRSLTDDELRALGVNF